MVNKKSPLRAHEIILLLLFGSLGDELLKDSISEHDVSLLGQ